MSHLLYLGVNQCSVLSTRGPDKSLARRGMQIYMFSQRCSCKFRSSGMLHCVSRCMLPRSLK